MTSQMIARAEAVVCSDAAPLARVIGTIAAARVDDRVLTDLDEVDLGQLRLTTFGFVFQQPHLLGSLSILDNIVLPGFLTKQHPRPTVVDRARALITRMGIGDLADSAITEASGGQLQRVGICRALINQPRILFGDEPTGGLKTSSPSWRRVGCRNTPDLNPGRAASPPGVVAFRPRVFDHA